MQPAAGRCQLSAPSMHKVKTGVQNMHMKCTCTSPRISVMKERLSHLFICCCVQVEFLSSHNCKVCTCGISIMLHLPLPIHAGNILVVCLRRQSGSLKKPFNSDKTGPAGSARGKRIIV